MEAPHDPHAKPGQRGHMAKYVSPYGKREGLAERLLDHIRTLGTDRRYSAVGTGLIADLEAASSAISGKPIQTEKPKVEYDL